MGAAASRISPKLDKAYFIHMSTDLMLGPVADTSIPLMTEKNPNHKNLWPSYWMSTIQGNIPPMVVACIRHERNKVREDKEETWD